MHIVIASGEILLIETNGEKTHIYAHLCIKEKYTHKNKYNEI